MVDGTTTQTDIKLGDEKTQTPQAKTYTQEEVDKQVNDRVSASKAEVGRLRANADSALKSANEALKRLDEREKELDARELAEAQDDPPRLTALQERQKRRVIETELAQTRQTLTQKDEELKQVSQERTEQQRERLVKDTASHFRVSETRLAKLAKFSDGSAEAIEDIAKELSDGKPPLKPDSGGAMGGGISEAEIRANYIKDPRNPVSKQAWIEMRQRKGR